jgi:hypothetical protein
LSEEDDGIGYALALKEIASPRTTLNLNMA